MEYESNEQILAELMDNIRTLHEENAKLIQYNERLIDINLKLSQERDDLNRKLKSIQAIFL